MSGFLEHSHTKVFELFKRMDSDLDGQISAKEMETGLSAMGFAITLDETTAFIRKVEPSSADGTTSLKALAKALRPGQSVKSLLKRPSDAPDMVTESTSLAMLGGARAFRVIFD